MVPSSSVKIVGVIVPKNHVNYKGNFQESLLYMSCFYMLQIYRDDSLASPLFRVVQTDKQIMMIVIRQR